MITAELFSEFYSISNDQENEIWRQEFEISNETFDNLLRVFYAEVRLKGMDDALEYATKICTGVNRIVVSSAHERVITDFLRFQICSSVLPLLSETKLFNKLFHWILNAISDDINDKVERSCHPDIIESFFATQIPYVNERIIPNFICWSQNLFYYSRVDGGLQSLTKYYLDHLFKMLLGLCNRCIFYENLDIALAQIIAWSSNNNLLEIKKQATSAIMYLYESPGYPEEWQKNIEFALACCGYEYTSIAQTQWIDKVLDGPYKLKAHEPMQLLALKHSSDIDEIMRNWQTIKTSISTYHVFISKNHKREKEIGYEICRSFNLLSPVIYQLLIKGKVDLLNELLGHYFQIPSEELIGSGNIYVVPYTQEGAMYVRQDDVFFSEKDATVFRKRITEATNNFLNWTVTIPDDFLYMAPVPSKHGVGVPNKLMGRDFENVLVDYFGLAEEKIKETVTNSSGYYFYSTYQLPLQALFVKTFGYSPPLIQSFYKPLPARRIKHVLIWQGDCTTSELECNAICRIFEHHDISYKRFNWYEAKKSDFITEYHSNNYDLVWISCHGEFDHFAPYNSRLVLNMEVENIEPQIISLSEISQLDESQNGRRLLVLNACDGASTSLHNSPSSIGYGAKLSHKFQSLISHQWPADNNACLALGCLLTINLCEGHTYLDAYNISLKQFIDNEHYTLDEMQTKYKLGEFREDILFGQNIDHTNIFYYGSLAYLE